MEDIILILKALSDEKRYGIVRLLLKGDYCVKALAQYLKITESAVSQHIKVLKKAGIITGERKGYYVHYTVNRDVLKKAGVEILNLSETQKQDCSMHLCHHKS